jgi:ABC-type Zn uptake system ZnuABC Zn-binding protein ZnuA
MISPSETKVLNSTEFAVWYVYDTEIIKNILESVRKDNALEKRVKNNTYDQTKELLFKKGGSAPKFILNKGVWVVQYIVKYGAEALSEKLVELMPYNSDEYKKVE